MFNKIILPNNLRIITAPMNGTNTVTVLVLCSTGSDNETEKERGISHFLEHMFFKGTKNRQTPQDIKKELDSMGSVSNAFTSHEYTGYFIKAGNIYLDQSLDLLSDIYQNSLLSPEEIEKERQVIIEEMHMYLDTPQRYIWDLHEGSLYGDQNAGWDVIGTEAHIRGFTPQQFSEYFHNQYTSKNTIIVVAGNFDEQKTVEKIKSYFGDIRSTETRPPRAFSDQSRDKKTLIHYKETDQTHILAGFQGVNAIDSEKYATEILGLILGGSWSSRMWDTVRDKLGLAYSVHTSNNPYSNRGYFTTYAGVAHENAEKAISAIVGEYKKIVEDGPHEEELKLAKQFIKGRTLIDLESSDSVANFIGGEEVITGKPMTTEEVFQKIDALTLGDIQSAAERVIQKGKMHLTVLGPYKDINVFDKLTF